MATWETIVIDDAGNVGKWAFMDLDANAACHIVCYDVTNTRLKYYYGSYPFQAWQSEVIADVPCQGCACAVDSAGVVHATYYDITDTNNPLLKYAKRTGVDTWAITTLGLTPRDVALIGDGGPCISLHPTTEYPFIVAGAFIKLGDIIWGAHGFYWDGAGWQGPETIMADVASMGEEIFSRYRPGLVAGESDYRLTAVYTQHGGYNGAGYARRAYDGSSWIHGGVGSGYTLHNTLVWDGDNIHILSDLQGILKHIHYTTSWQTETIENYYPTGYSHRAWVELGTDGLLQVAWSRYGGGAHQLVFLTGTTGSWSAEEVVDTGAVFQWASLRRDSYNRPRIAYYDSTNGNLKFAYDISAGPEDTDMSLRIHSYSSNPDWDFRFQYFRDGAWHDLTDRVIVRTT